MIGEWKVVNPKVRTSWYMLSVNFRQVIESINSIAVTIGAGHLAQSKPIHAKTQPLIFLYR